VKIEYGGTLDMSGVTAYANFDDLEGSGSVVLGGNTLGLSGTMSEFDGVISGSGGLQLSGGAARFGGKNTYTGQTLIGTLTTLALVGDGSIANSAEVNIGVGGILDISGTNDGASIKTLNGFGGSVLPTVVLGGQTLKVTGGGSFDGIISGSGGLDVAGGALALTRANTYTGLTTIDAGATLQLGNGSVVGSIASSSIVDNGSLVFDWPYGTMPYGAVISGTGSVVVVSTNQPGTLQLTGANTYTGGTIINSGELQSTYPLHGDVTVNTGGALDGVPEVDGNLSSTGSVNVHGGDTTVTGNYAQTEIGPGRSAYLAVSLGSKLAVNGTATLNGGTLAVTGADSGYVANTHTDVLTATGGVTGTFANLV
jgi:autotransporter-associated beta strand protein